MYKYPFMMRCKGDRVSVPHRKMYCAVVHHSQSQPLLPPSSTTGYAKHMRQTELSINPLIAGKIHSRKT